MEQIEFLLMQAVSEEENENSDHALALYTDAAEICLEKVDFIYCTKFQKAVYKLLNISTKEIRRFFNSLIYCFMIDL